MRGPRAFLVDGEVSEGGSFEGPTASFEGPLSRGSSFELNLVKRYGDLKRYGGLKRYGRLNATGLKRYGGSKRYGRLNATGLKRYGA